MRPQSSVTGLVQSPHHESMSGKRITQRKKGDEVQEGTTVYMSTFGDVLLLLCFIMVLYHHTAF